MVKDSSDQILDVQVNYLWNQDGTLVTDRVEACFITLLPPLSITPFKVEKLGQDLSNSHSISTTELYNFDSDQINLDQYQELIKKIDSDSKPAEISIQSNEWKLVFSSVDGMLRRVIQLDHSNSDHSDGDHSDGDHSNGVHSNGGHSSVIKSHEVKLSFMTFSTTPGRKDHRSGAYLFLPGNEFHLLYVIYCIYKMYIIYYIYSMYIIYYIYSMYIIHYIYNIYIFIYYITD